MSTRSFVSTRRSSVAGYSLPALLAALAIMALALLLAVPSWNYLARDDKEQELIFRGRQISAAIARFQRKNGNALPTSLDQLVKGRFLRQAYKDPMTQDGVWRILRPGEGAPRPPMGQTGGRPSPSPSPSPQSTPVFGGNSGTAVGPMGGVASRSTDTGIRLVNGSSNYNQWLFGPNIPFVIGGQGAMAGPPRGPNQGAPPLTLRAPDAEAPRVSR